jgi:hypothetical protein
MNLNDLLNTISEANPLAQKEKDPIDGFIRKLNDKIRFNEFFKRKADITTFMSSLPVRPVVKNVIKEQLEKIIPTCYDEATKYKNNSQEIINNISARILKKVEGKVSGADPDIREAIEFARVEIDGMFEMIHDKVFASLRKQKDSLNVVQQLTRQEYHLVNQKFLETKEEKDYYKNTIFIVKYFTENLIETYMVLFLIQEVIELTIKNIRKNKEVKDIESKSNIVATSLVRFYQQFVSAKFGSSIGALFAVIIKDYFDSRTDRKEQNDHCLNALLQMLAIKA